MSDSNDSSTDQAPVRIVLHSGQVATLVSINGDKVAIQSPEPAPPGATVRGSVATVPTEFELKVRNCVKNGQYFNIDGRLRNATRPLKALLSEGKLPS